MATISPVGVISVNDAKKLGITTSSVNVTTGSVNADPPRQFGVPRTEKSAFIMRSDKNPHTNFVWFCNPSEVSWRIGFRGGEQKTKTGYVIHAWFDARRKTYYDEPILNFSLQSGNIFPLNLGTGQATLADGHRNFYDFLTFLNEDPLLSDGTPNIVTLEYHSMVFPGLQLRGVWSREEGTSFTDSSETPNTVNSWTAKFIVYSTNPSFYSPDALAKEFTKVGFRPTK